MKFHASIFAAAIAAVAPFAGAADSPAFPVRPIRMIIPFPAGGVGDVVGRGFAEKVGAALGQQIVVENLSGGSGALGMTTGMRARPDGYTITQVVHTNVVLPLLQKDVEYNLERDFASIAGVGQVPVTLAVSAKGGYKSVADLVAAAKTPPGIFYGSGGNGSVAQLTATRFLQESKTTATNVTFKGNAPLTQALAGGQVHFYFGTTVDTMELTRSGHLRILAVTSDDRLPVLPDVPTMKELGYKDFHAAVWYGYYVPAKTPREVIARLTDAFAKATADADLRERLGKFQFLMQLRRPADFDRFVAAETREAQRVIVENGIKAE